MKTTTTHLLSLAALSLAACNDVPVVLEWTDITPTPGCYFLSGPRNLGSEYPLGERGTLDISGRNVSLVAGDAHFSGELHGADFTLERNVQCESFPGFVFRFTETISGDLTSGEPATYSYRECQLLEDGTCEAGYCSLDASLELRRARRNEPSYTPPASFCGDLCTHRDAIAAEIECGNDACVDNCSGAFDGRCDREAVELGTCENEQDAAAFACFGTVALMPGACDAQNDTYFSCLIAPPPSGGCVEL